MIIVSLEVMVLFSRYPIEYILPYHMIKSQQQPVKRRVAESL